MFPQVDPIPLPAPVWLFKVLEILTVSLHFIAMQLLVGGLIIGTVWALMGRRNRNPVLTDAAGRIAARLPIIMVYVINLGVPPLLFAQVLYGRAIYTSSILIGAVWISVIFLLMAVYSLLYMMAAHARAGRPWWRVGVFALVGTAVIAFIYSSNMTLMIRPQAWLEMYRNNPLGTQLNGSDPTVWPRWLFMIAGGLSTGGAGLVVLALSRTVVSDTTRFLRLWGTRLLAIGIGLQSMFGVWAVLSQPADVRAALTDHRLYLLAMVVWGVLAVALFAASHVAHRQSSQASWPMAGTLSGLLFVQVVTMAVIRGGIRDLTLLSHGLDVWDRQVHSNWLITIAFLVLFVIGLVVIGWLISVVARAKRVEEHYV